MSALKGFRLSPQDFTFYGQGLERAECVYIDDDGIFVSDSRSALARVNPDGPPSLLGRGIVEANGFSRRRNGNFIVAGLGDCTVYEIAPNGDTQILLEEVEGQELGAVNCAWVDRQDRIWVSVMTRSRHWSESLKTGKADGYIVLIENSRARLVADGLFFTNEAKVSPCGGFLYVSETRACRIVRYPILSSGDLGQQQTVGPAHLGHGGLPDGFAFDVEGNIWVVMIHLNSLYVITREGELLTVFSDPQPAALDMMLEALGRGEATPAHAMACAGRVLAMPTSIAFGGPDRRTAYLGSVAMPCLPRFRVPIAGAAVW